MFKFKLQDNQCEEHFFLNWNFMPKTKKIKLFRLNETDDLEDQPKNARFCSSSSYKILDRKTLYSKLEFYAENKNDVNRFVSTCNFNIMFKFKLQDNQREEHYIPNWNLMPKTENHIFFCLNETV